MSHKLAVYNKTKNNITDMGVSARADISKTFK